MTQSGSLEPMNANKDKWHAGLTSDQLAQLDEIQQDIAGKIDETVITVARARLFIGDRLNRARGIFPGDQEFGKWRRSVLPSLAPRTCTSYMAMAREFRDAPKLVESMGWAVARELISAPSDVKDEVKSKVAGGETVTKDEVKSKKAKPTSAPLPSGADKVNQTTPPPEQVESSSKRRESLDDRMLKFLDQTHQYRLENVDEDFPELDDYSRCALSFGFPPSVLDMRPNLDVWLAVYDHIKSAVVNDAELFGILNNRYTQIKEAW